MDTDQYYKEKYFKYKLKYVTLKKQLGGDKKTPAAADKKTPAAADKKTPVAADKKTPAVADKKTPVAADKKTPAVADKKTPVKSDDDYQLKEILNQINNNINRIRKLMIKVVKNQKNYDLTKLEDILKTFLNIPSEKSKKI
jgi:predicted  nucleic acid-binding Zn-ribbon protein